MWDVFICHASEDKDAVARPLAEELTRRGYSVWYDDLTLKIGDNLRRSIERGLRDCRFGLVVLSPSFFQQEWPQRELDGLISREVDGAKVILPVWHEITRTDVAFYSPILADRRAERTSSGIVAICNAVEEVLRQPHSSLISASVGSGKSRPPVASTPALNRGYESFEKLSADLERMTSLIPALPTVGGESFSGGVGRGTSTPFRVALVGLGVFTAFALYTIVSAAPEGMREGRWAGPDNIAVFEPTQNVIWTRSSIAKSALWGDARNACAELRLQGKAGWRLPTQVELESMSRGDVHNFLGVSEGDLVWTSTTGSARSDENGPSTSWVWIGSPRGAGRFSRFDLIQSRGELGSAERELLVLCVRIPLPSEPAWLRVWRRPEKQTFQSWLEGPTSVSLPLEVWVDNTFVGISTIERPLDHELAPGEHDIRTRQGGLDCEVPLSIDLRAGEARWIERGCRIRAELGVWQPDLLKTHFPQ